MPLTHRGLSSAFAVVTGRLAADAPTAPDWDALARIDTVVVLMGLAAAGEIAQRLINAGRDPATPTLVVAAATLPEQQAIPCTLATLADAAAQVGGDAPATIIVGAVAALAEAQSAVPALPLAALLLPAFRVIATSDARAQRRNKRRKEQQPQIGMQFSCCGRCSLRLSLRPCVRCCFGGRAGNRVQWAEHPGFPSSEGHVPHGDSL